MQDTELFTPALGLSSPWEVTQTHLDTENKRLDIHLDFAQGSRFTCGVCADAKAAPYDSKQKTWRHLNSFQYEAYLHARVPRVACPNGCRVHRVEVPWARTGSGFTLLFEAWLMLLFKDIAVSRVGELVNEHDTRLWRVLKHYVSEGRKKEDFSEVKEIGVDETSCKKGRDYISVFCDLDKRRVIYATQGKDASTVKAFTEDLEAHKGVKENIEVVSCDMSPAFISGVNSELKDAQITFDRFHVMKVINDAVNSVRVAEVKDNELLKGTRYVWLKNANKLSKKQQATVDSLSKQHLKTARAYQIKLSFQGLYEQADRASGEAYLKRWYYWATHSRIGPIIAAAKTIKAHWEGILNWFDSGRTNALLEGINSLIQAAKSKARGYRNKENFIAITYLIGAKLTLTYPHEIARNPEIEHRANMRYEAEQQEYEEKLKVRQEKESASGKKLRGRPPKAPQADPKDNDQMNFTDEESRIMPSSQGFVQAYNAQAGVDIDSHLIIANHLSQKANDKQEMEPALEQLQAIDSSLGKVDGLLAGAGYHSEHNVKRCEDADIVPYIPGNRERHNQPLKEPHELPPCPQDADLMTQMKHRLKTKAGKALYAKRKSTVETVFGIIKEVLGFRQFHLRGREAAEGEWNLVCMAWNLKRMYALSS